MKTLSSPTGKYLLPDHPKSFHSETTEWLSGIEFYKTELAFLSRLLDKAFLRVQGKQKEAELKESEKKINAFRTKHIVIIYKSLVRHEHNLSMMDIHKFNMNKNAVCKEHVKQQLAMRRLKAALQKVKQEIFDAVEKQLRLTKKINKKYEEGTLVL